MTSWVHHALGSREEKGETLDTLGDRHPDRGNASFTLGFLPLASVDRGIVDVAHPRRCCRGHSVDKLSHRS